MINKKKINIKILTMKTKILKKITLVLSLIVLASCSKDDDPMPMPISTPTPTNKALLGLFDITLNGSIQANLLFESGNKVNYGFATINDMRNDLGRRTTYTLVDNQISFSMTDGAQTYNLKCTYEPSTGKLLNGTYGTGTSFTNQGVFIGQKYAPASSGVDLLKGYWVGKYGFGVSATPNQNYFAVFEEGNKITTGDTGSSLFDSSYTSGSFSISGNTVTATYTVEGGGSTISILGTYDPSTKKITGTYGSGANTSGLGTFYLEAKNFN